MTYTKYWNFDRNTESFTMWTYLNLFSRLVCTFPVVCTEVRTVQKFQKHLSSNGTHRRQNPVEEQIGDNLKFTDLFEKQET